MTLLMMLQAYGSHSLSFSPYRHGTTETDSRSIEQEIFLILLGEYAYPMRNSLRNGGGKQEYSSKQKVLGIDTFRGYTPALVGENSWIWRFTLSIHFKENGFTGPFEIENEAALSKQTGKNGKQSIQGCKASRTKISLHYFMNWRWRLAYPKANTNKLWFESSGLFLSEHGFTYLSQFQELFWRKKPENTFLRRKIVLCLRNEIDAFEADLELMWTKVSTLFRAKVNNFPKHLTS